MRTHLHKLLADVKSELDKKIGEITQLREAGIDVDHSLHHGGTMYERLIQDAKIKAIKSLSDFEGDEYPTTEEFVEIQDVINAW